MTQARRGDTVRVHYTCRLDDGTVVETTIGGEPFQFTIGGDQVSLDLEQAVVGMNPGESKAVRIPAERAYGPYCCEMVLVVDRAQFPVNLKLEVGQTLQIREEDGDRIAVTVIDVSESGVTLDANHPLARKDLTFDIQLADIVKPVVTG